MKAANVILGAILVSPMAAMSAQVNAAPASPPVSPSSAKSIQGPKIQPAHREEFTQLEQVIAKDLSDKQNSLQQEVYDFMDEVKMRHPGYMFSQGTLVPIPPPAPAPAPEKKEDSK